MLHKICHAISDLKTSINEDPTYFKSLSGVNYALEAEDDTEIVEDIPEALIEDDLSPNESQAIHDAINRAFIKATSSEVAVKMSGKLFRSQRLRSKQAFDRDSKTQTCSRQGCTDRRKLCAAYFLQSSSRTTRMGPRAMRGERLTYVYVMHAL